MISLGFPTPVIASGNFEGLPIPTQQLEENRSLDSDDMLSKEEGIPRDTLLHKTKKKKTRCTKSREKSRELVFDEGVSMQQDEETEQTVLVGRVRGRNYTSATLTIWTFKIWGNILE